uniref:Uncharacterized protein n=1 Tax=Romanomermis culicivorax TaxID=13658 RepID=A0A915HF65_ROMCU
YGLSNDENLLKHLKILIEDSLKEFLAQKHESSRDYDKNSKKLVAAVDGKLDYEHDKLADDDEDGRRIRATKNCTMEAKKSPAIFPLCPPKNRPVWLALIVNHRAQQIVSSTRKCVSTTEVAQPLESQLSKQKIDVWILSLQTSDGIFRFCSIM